MEINGCNGLIQIFVCKEGFLKSFYSWFETHCNHPNETSEEYLARMGQV